MQLRQRQTCRRQRRFRLGAFGRPLHRLSSRDLRGHLKFVAIESSLVNGLAHLVAAGSPSDEVQLALLKRAVSDGDLARPAEQLAGDVLAFLLEIEEGLTEIAVAGGDTKDPETG